MHAVESGGNGNLQDMADSYKALVLFSTVLVVPVVLVAADSAVRMKIFLAITTYTITGNAVAGFNFLL